MLKGFIFDHKKCVACNACNAACILENKWSIHPREIYVYNSEALSALPMINLSLACNHCDTAICLDGCPTASLYRELVTGAVIIDEKRCIGCKYCQWNCPYDAPKFNAEKGIIGKCNLCYSVLIEGGLPVCTTSCPTGALKFDEISQTNTENFPLWFPDKKLKPALRFSTNEYDLPLRIIPETIFEPQYPVSANKERRITGELILVAFSFLTTMSVAIFISSLIKGIFPNESLIISINVFGGFISLFHLGRPLKAWRSVANLKSSPLSREISLFTVYFVISFITVTLKFPFLLITSSIIGLILLITIDTVYIYADKRRTLVTHSGQTFLSALLIVSFLSGTLIPFIFIALIKLAASLYNVTGNKISEFSFGIRFLRLAILLITAASFISNISFRDPVLVSLFLTGELIDRLIYYHDFDPININSLINRHIITSGYEKKRC
jgi:Fe-S-cluster-containing dehydrogenase component/DMSO reductase anchor subunit